MDAKTKLPPTTFEVKENGIHVFSPREHLPNFLQLYFLNLSDDSACAKIEEGGWGNYNLGKVPSGLGFHYNGTDSEAIGYYDILAADEVINTLQELDPKNQLVYHTHEGLKIALVDKDSNTWLAIVEKPLYATIHFIETGAY